MAVSAKCAMRTRQSHQGRLRILKHTKASTKQTDKQSIMATEQAYITEAIVQIAAEVARGAVQTIAMASTDNSAREQNVGPKLGGLILKQPTFNWSSTDKYAEPRNFKIDVKYVSNL